MQLCRFLSFHWPQLEGDTVWKCNLTNIRLHLFIRGMEENCSFCPRIKSDCLNALAEVRDGQALSSVSVLWPNEPWRIEKMTCETCWNIDVRVNKVGQRRKLKFQGEEWKMKVTAWKPTVRGCDTHTRWVTNEGCHTEDSWQGCRK